MKFRTFYDETITECYITDDNDIERFGMGIMNNTCEGEFLFCPLLIRIERFGKSIYLSTEIFKWTFFIHLNSSIYKDSRIDEMFRS